MGVVLASPLLVTILIGAALIVFIFKRFNFIGREVSKEIADASTTEKDTTEADFDREKYPNGKVVALYGSESGTAALFASQLQEEGEEYGFFVDKVDVNDVSELDSEFYSPDPSSAPHCYIFLMATYGEGDPTSNAVQFVELLKQKDEEGDSSFLSYMSYGVFGLGNTEYEHYNAIGKMMDPLLAKLGGERIIELGLGNDQDDIESDFEQWKEGKLWPELKRRFAVSDESSVSTTTPEEKEEHIHVADCPFYIKYLEEGEEVNPDDVPLEKVHIGDKHYFTAIDSPIIDHKELLQPSSTSSTLHIEIDASNKFKYQTADNLGVLALNPPNKVQAIASKLGYDLNKSFRIHSKTDNTPIHYFPTPCTIQDFLSRYCDFETPPRRSELKHLACFALNEEDRSALLRISSKEGKDEYKEKIVDARAGFFDILEKKFPSVELPLERMIQFCPRLHPRYYTISSSSSVFPQRVHITAAVLRVMMEDGTEFRGLCSNYMKEVAEGEGDRILRVFPRDSTFRLPKDATKPIIMIGPGTGIAPMRALLQERQHQQQTLNLAIGPSILYFGCKHQNQDFLYQSELENFQKEGVLTQLHLAFSRDQDHKVYVQHLLSKNMADTWKLVDEDGAYIYVCGGMKMGHDVLDTLREMVMKMSERDLDQAKQYLDRMHGEGRFIQELWH